MTYEELQKLHEQLMKMKAQWLSDKYKYLVCLKKNVCQMKASTIKS